MEEGLRANWAEQTRRLAALLPADELDRLRPFSTPAALSVEAEGAFAEALQQVIGAVASLHHKLVSFLPRYLLDLSPRPGQPHGELLEGSFVFADVTGFTALTGELSKRGTEGREEMNRLMNALFAALLEPLLTSGGDLLFFAGDAVLAWFPGQPEGRDARWATRTALRLVEAVSSFGHLQTPYGSFSLTMSAGVERGRAFAAVVGTSKRMELLISGGPVQGAMRAEAEAEPGQVVAGDGVLSFLRSPEFQLQGRSIEGIRGGELGDYEPVPFARRRPRFSAFSRRVPELTQQLEHALKRIEAITPFIPADLFTQIARGEDIRQHPPVAVQFVNLVGIEDIALSEGGPEQATAVLQRFFALAQEIVSDREGIVSQVDPYAEGFTLLSPFGAPTHHEGAPRLAVSAALEMAHLLDSVNREFGLDPPIVQRTGLAYDRIFAGETGYRHRREYVVAGPTVNLAARLMSKAGFGQIVLGATAWAAVEEDFVADSLPPARLKGIREPVRRFAVRGLRRGKGLHLTDYPLVGRRRELAVLQRHVEQAGAGQGGTLALVGEAGAGKTRLATALAETARHRGLAVLSGRCRPFARTTPYLPWAEMVSEWLELDETQVLEARRRRLQEQLDRFDLALSLPAFADLLGLPPVGLPERLPEGPARQGPGVFAVLSRQVEPGEGDGRQLAALLAGRSSEAGTREPRDERPSLWHILSTRASIPQALTQLLERQAQRQPTLAIIEDHQWMDPDSRDVLESVRAAVSRLPLFLLVTTRPEADWTGEQLLLPPLSRDDVQALAAFALQATHLDTSLAAWVCEHAGGNPLFTLSYCRALRTTGAVVVDPASSEARWSGPPPTLPLSLHQLLLAQAGQLEREARAALEFSAVIGATFTVALLERLCQNTLSSDQLDHALGQIARRSFIAPPPPAQTHTFTSQSLHEAVYSSVPHDSRRAWHEEVGDRLAQAGELTRYERLEQIAYHYARSGDAPKAARFSRLAGDKARARQADAVALEFYAQALAVEDGEGVAAEQQRAHEGMGDVHALRGDGPAAREAYQRALAGAPPEHAGRLKAKLALVDPLDGRTDPEPLEKAREGLPPSAPLQQWLATAMGWLRAATDGEDTADVLRRNLLPDAREPARSLLLQALESLDTGGPLPPYSDLFALFARSCLRRPPGGEP